MDINSIGSMTRLTAVTPTPAQTPNPGNTQAAVRENSAAVPHAPNTPPTAVNSAQDQRQNLQSSIDALNEFIKPQNTSLEFSIDDDSGTVVVKVMDKETKEVIKQFPSEEALELAKALDKLKGLLVQQKA
ncbi:MAG: flagellar protein FlaG [Azonexus sp.]|nr:flagellar protein FlaG [Azonexus sp.]